MAKFKKRDLTRSEKFSKKLKLLAERVPSLNIDTSKGKKIIKALGQFLDSVGSKTARLIRTARNQLVTQEPIERVRMRDAAIEKIKTNSEQEIKRVIEKYSNGKLTIEKLRENLETTIKRQTLAAGIIGAGGIGNLTENVLEVITKILSDELSYLDGFIEDISTRDITNRDRARIMQYANSGNSVSETARQQFNLDQAKGNAQELEEIRLLGASEHCDDCVDLANSWQPFGTLPRIGQGTVCGNKCNCRMEYRPKNTDGPTRETSESNING